MMGAMQMQMIARGFLVWELTGTGQMVGLVSAAGALPMLGLSLFGGAIADRADRKLLIQLGQGTVALVALVIAVYATQDIVSWKHLLVAALLTGSAFAFMEPARQALIPQLVGRDRLSNAMALNGAGMSATILVAPAISGLLYTVIGPDGVYYVIAAMVLIAAALTSSIRVPPVEARKAASPVFADIRAGLSYIKLDRLVLVLLLSGMATAVLSIPFKFLLPVFVTDVYERGAGALGLLISMMGLGTLVGSLAIASLGRRRRGMLLLLGGLASGVGLMLVALVPSFFIAVPLMVFLGLGEAGRRVLNVALIMERVEDQYRGRVMSVFMMNFGLMPLALLPAGVAFDLLGARETVGVLGALVLAVSVLVLITQGRLRRIQ